MVQVETELSDVCKDILQVLEQHLIPSAQAGESKVFYSKVNSCTQPRFIQLTAVSQMQGDYHRYLAEFAGGDGRKGASDAAHDAYKQATEIAQSDVRRVPFSFPVRSADGCLTQLAPTHPIRLGLALNFSVFYYEILNSPDKACHLAKQAFDDAIAELDTVRFSRTFP